MSPRLRNAQLLDALDTTRLGLEALQLSLPVSAPQPLYDLLSATGRSFSRVYASLVPTLEERLR